MPKNTTIADFLEDNPELISGNYHLTAKKLGVTYEAVRSAARKLRKEYKGKLPTKKRLSEEEFKGVLTKAKTWQLPNGEWRESLTFSLDYEDQWQQFKSSFLADIKKIGASNRKLPKVPKDNAGICLEISLPDLHFGKGDIEKLTENFIFTVSKLLARVEISGYAIDRILLPIGNDGLNSEGRKSTTTGGTPMLDSVSWRDSFRQYWGVLSSIIEVLSNTYKVDVLVIPGNHDTERMFYIGDVLTAFFIKKEAVAIQNTGEYRYYYEYGVNMLMFTHGDKEKLADLPLIMATEQPEMFARTKYREVHMGHFHKEKVNEFRGIKTRFLPSICTTDEWHKMMGYKHQKAAQAFLWNRTKGLDGYFQINIFDN